MFVKRFFEPALAQASYLIGCQQTDEAIVIDANRDVEPYIQAAAQEGLRITHVTETHIHADYVSGSRELAHRTGASLCLSDEGDKDWKYQFEHARKLKHGDRISIGNIRIDVLHTPGHTPEHLAFLITDGAAANQPIAAVTGDFEAVAVNSNRIPTTPLHHQVHKVLIISILEEQRSFVLSAINRVTWLTDGQKSAFPRHRHSP